MPALLTKMSSVPKASVVLATAARSSSAEALSAFRDNAFPPMDSISLTSWRAFSSELEYVNATDAPSAASRRTMPAPIPREPPVTRATLPLNDFVCMWPPKPPGHPLCHVMDCSVQNEHSAGAAHIRANGGKLIPMQPSPIADTSRLLFPSLRFCIVSPSGCFSHLQTRVERRGTGILILPIHCLFLSLPTISCRFIHDSALFLILKGALRGTRGESEDCKQRAISTRS